MATQRTNLDNALHRRSHYEGNSSFSSRMSSGRRDLLQNELHDGGGGGQEDDDEDTYSHDWDDSPSIPSMPSMFQPLPALASGGGESDLGMNLSVNPNPIPGRYSDPMPTSSSAFGPRMGSPHSVAASCIQEDATNLLTSSHHLTARDFHRPMATSPSATLPRSSSHQTVAAGYHRQAEPHNYSAIGRTNSTSSSSHPHHILTQYPFGQSGAAVAPSLTSAAGGAIGSTAKLPYRTGSMLSINTASGLPDRQSSGSTLGIGPQHPVSVKEFEIKYNELKRENFNLKLRVYLLEKEKTGISQPECESEIAREFHRRDKAVKALEKALLDRERSFQDRERHLAAIITNYERQLDAARQERIAVDKDLEESRSICQLLMLNLREFVTFWRHHLEHGNLTAAAANNTAMMSSASVTASRADHDHYSETIHQLIAASQDLLETASTSLYPDRSSSIITQTAAAVTSGNRPPLRRTASLKIPSLHDNRFSTPTPSNSSSASGSQPRTPPTHVLPSIRPLQNLQDPHYRYSPAMPSPPNNSRRPEVFRTHQNPNTLPVANLSLNINLDQPPNDGRRHDRTATASNQFHNLFRANQSDEDDEEQEDDDEEEDEETYRDFTPALGPHRSTSMTSFLGGPTPLRSSSTVPNLSEILAMTTNNLSHLSLGNYQRNHDNNRDHAHSPHNMVAANYVSPSLQRRSLFKSAEILHEEDPSDGDGDGDLEPDMIQESNPTICQLPILPVLIDRSMNTSNVNSPTKQLSARSQASPTKSMHSVAINTSPTSMVDKILDNNKKLSNELFNNENKDYDVLRTQLDAAQRKKAKMERAISRQVTNVDKLLRRANEQLSRKHNKHAN